MIFTKFHYKILIRVAALTVCLFVFAWCVLDGWYLRSVYAAIVVLFLVTEMIGYITKFTKHVNEMLMAVRERDFSMHFRKSDHKELDALYESLNSIGNLFRRISTEKEIKHRHLENLIAHLKIAIVSFDENDAIHLSNVAFRELNRKPGIESLSQVDSRLQVVIRSMSAGDTSVVKFHDGINLRNLSVHLTEFKLDQQTFRLVSIQDITNELSVGEVDAWHKLIRVLTHEIMNSITPIISLSDSLAMMLSNSSGSTIDMKVVASGVHAIKSRSQGLQTFTKRYRQLTQIKEPVFREVEASALIDEVLLLFKGEADKRNVAVTAEHQGSRTILADKELLQQALVNLFQNAMEALEQTNSPVITLRTFSFQERLIIEVSNNGPAIEPEILDKIFIPFYTTKANGSGIGLAVARQIVLLHKGEIIAENQQRGVTFRIIL